jgi:hypothetical protein
MNSSIIRRQWLLPLLIIHVYCTIVKVDSENHSSVFPARSCSSVDSFSHYPSSSGTSQWMIPLYGNHTWTLDSTDGIYQSLNAKVPGDILSDLHRNNLISYPFFDNQFLSQRHVWMGPLPLQAHLHPSYCLQTFSSAIETEYEIPSLEQRTRTWVYSTEFYIDSVTSLSNVHVSPLRHLNPFTISKRTQSYALVVESIKMGASIHINGIHIGNITNQFLRYIFPISDSNLHFNSTNYMTITFDPQIDTHGRFMACSGGWDWAPYSKAAEVSCSSRRVLTFGIVRPIYFIQVEHVAIVHVVPKVLYLGDSNCEYLKDYKDFELTIDVHLQLFSGYMTTVDDVIVLRSDFWKEDIRQPVTNGKYMQEDGNEFLIVTVKTNVKRDLVELWWPRGYGNQDMYNLKVCFENAKQGISSTWVHKRIGR